MSPAVTEEGHTRHFSFFQFPKRLVMGVILHQSLFTNEETLARA